MCVSRAIETLSKPFWSNSLCIRRSIAPEQATHVMPVTLNSILTNLEGTFPISVSRVLESWGSKGDSDGPRDGLNGITF